MVNLTVHRKESPRFANNISVNEQVSDYLEIIDEGWKELSLKLHNVADYVSSNDFGKSTILGRNENFMRPFNDAILTYESLYNESSWINENPFIKRKDVLTDPSFSEKIDVPMGYKIIVIGDLHSGLQSLVQIIDNLVEKGILSNNLELKHGYLLIFLGDLIDRGGLGLDILHIVFRIKVLNFQNMFIINGNHEDVSMYNKGGFGHELSTQILNQEHVIKIQSLLTYLPSVIFAFLNDSSEWLQFNHGGIEPEYNPREFMESDFDYHFHGFDIGHDLVYMGLRWNDFNGNVRGLGLSSRGSNVFEYGKDATERYLSENNISGIIRGHQELTHFMALQKTNGSSRDMQVIDKVEMLTIPENHWKQKFKTGWESIPIANIFDDFSVVTSSSANRARNLGMNVYMEISNSKSDFHNAQQEINRNLDHYTVFADELQILDIFNFMVTANFGQFIDLEEDKLGNWNNIIEYLKENQSAFEFEFYNLFLLESYNIIK